ncbi:MAG: hypothetical protein HRT94_07330 [Alphaproteobacteria bacterium]|nr:hypothetical protein [Alphaproteobacteria bacterium]
MLDSRDVYVSADVTKQMINEACDDASLRLSELTGAHISVSIATICELFKAHTMWGGTPLEWRRDPFYQTQDVRRFTIAITSESHVLGLCRSSHRLGQSTLTMEKAQSLKGRAHPLKGRAIAAFTEVNLAIAKNFDLRRISAEQPYPFLLPKLKEAGFDTTYQPIGCIASAELPITESTSVSWPTYSK